MKQEKSYSNVCGICERGRTAPDGRSVLCTKRGVMPADGCCRKFKYDPLKRKPRETAPLQEFSNRDFEI